MAAILSALLSLFSPSTPDCPAMVTCYADPDCGGDADMERIADECGWDDDGTDADAAR